jgi:hypothetical protein
LRYCPDVSLKGLRTITVNLRMAGVQTGIRTLHLPNANEKALTLEPNLFGYAAVVDGCYRAHVTGDWLM